MRLYVEFESEYPMDEVVDEESGDVMIPPGENIIEAYRLFLKAEGVDVGRAQLHSFYGHDLEFQIGKARLWHMIQFVEPFLLISDRVGFRLPFVGRAETDKVIKESIELFRRFVKSDEKLKIVGEFTEEEYNSGFGKQ